MLGAVAAALAAKSPLPAHASALGVAEGILPAGVSSEQAQATPLAQLLSADVSAALRRDWAALMAAEASSVRDSKARDSDRGRRIIPDYDKAHAQPTPATDGVVRILTQRADAAASLAKVD